MNTRKISSHGHAVYADATACGQPLNVYEGLRNRSIDMSGSNLVIASSAAPAQHFNTLAFGSKLPFAAKELGISPEIRDYTLVPVAAMPSDLPNRNGVGFPLTELKAWRVDDGMLAYETFTGKPVHIEHENKDPSTAVGIIVDSALVPMRGFGQNRLWKLMLLLAIDRNKGAAHVQRVVNREINSYSMGAWVEAYSCGYCGAPAGACRHIDLRRPNDFYLLDGKVVYRRVHNIRGFECSIVEDPAFLTAISDHLMSVPR